MRRDADASQREREHGWHLPNGVSEEWRPRTLSQILKARSDVIESEGYDAEEVGRRIAADHAREEELGLKFGQPATARADPAIEIEPEDRERPMQSEENAA